MLGISRAYAWCAVWNKSHKLALAFSVAWLLKWIRHLYTHAVRCIDLFGDAQHFKFCAYMIANQKHRSEFTSQGKEMYAELAWYGALPMIARLGIIASTSIVVELEFRSQTPESNLTSHTFGDSWVDSDLLVITEVWHWGIVFISRNYLIYQNLLQLGRKERIA